MKIEKFLVPLSTVADPTDEFTWGPVAPSVNMRPRPSRAAARLISLDITAAEDLRSKLSTSIMVDRGSKEGEAGEGRMFLIFLPPLL